MAVNRLIRILALCGFAGAVYAQPLTLVVDTPAPHGASPAQICLISTKTCINLSKVPAGLCPIESRNCAQSGNLVAVSATPLDKATHQ
jgi:hypothetical protein